MPPEPDELFRYVEWADELDIDSIWLPDHAISERPELDPTVLMSVIAARTRDIKMGPSVLAVPGRNPAEVALEDYCLVTRNMYRITEQESPIPPGEQATVTLPIPPTEPSLFRHKATSDILRLLVDNPYERFTIRKLARLTDHSAQSVKRAVDVLEPNSVVVVETQGNRRLVGINRQRISKPDDPVLGITRSEFHPPVRTALDRLQAELGHILGALVFGSVARGRADR